MTDDLNRLRAVTLTDDERALIDEAEGWSNDMGAHLVAAVESIVAARTTYLLDRAERAETERDAMKFDRNNAEKVEGLAIGLESDLRSTRVKVELLAERLDEMTLSRDKYRNRCAALRAAVTNLADEFHDEADERNRATGDKRNCYEKWDAAQRLRSLLAAAPTETEGEK